MNTWNPGMKLEQIEEAAIRGALQFYRGNRSQTASALGISERTLYTKLEQYDADDKRREEARLARHAEILQDVERQRKGHTGAAAGIRVESAAQTPTELQLPVHERTQIQEVLPTQTSKGSQKRASKSI